MTSDETKRITTALRVKVRYPDVDTFVERFAVNVGRSGIFIPTPTPKPVGSEVRFEVRLADDKAVLIGQGVVRWLREPATDRTRATTGMAIELQRVSRESRDVLMKMLQVRKRRGLVDGPGGLPMIEDDHREEGEDGEERASSSRSMRRTTMPPPVGPAPVASETTPPPIAVVPEPAAVAEPVAEPEPVALAEPIAEPVAVPEPEPVAESVPEPVAESVPEPVAESVPEPEPVADFEPEPVTQSLPQPAPLAAAEPVVVAEAADELVLDGAAPGREGEGHVAAVDSSDVPIPLPRPPTGDDFADERTREVLGSRAIPIPPPPPEWTPRARRPPLRPMILPAPDEDGDDAALDLDAIFDRARALTSLTSEDASLADESALDMAAVPESINADEASHRLAEMLGTAPPVRRTSIRAATPLPVMVPPAPLPVMVPPARLPPPPVARTDRAPTVRTPTAHAPTEAPPADTGWDDDDDRTPPIAVSARRASSGPAFGRMTTAPLPDLGRRPAPASSIAIPPRVTALTRPPTPAPATPQPLVGTSLSGERRRLDLDVIERQEAERERAARDRDERERAEQVRVARVELATIDPLSEPLEEDDHEPKISLAESLAPMDSGHIELAPAMGYLDDLELDDRRNKRSAGPMPLQPPRAQIPPATPGRPRRSSTPPPPPRSVPIPTGGIMPPSPARTVPILTIPASPRPAAFTGRPDEPVPRSVGSNPGELTTAPQGDIAEAVDETTQVSGPAPDGTAEVDLDVEKDVVIEFDDA